MGAAKKLCCWRSTRPKAVLAVGFASRSAAAVLSARNDGRQGFSAACSYQRQSGDPRLEIAYKCSSVVKNDSREFASIRG
jgi:hypothetical protein